MEPNFTHSIMVLLAFMAQKGFERRTVEKILHHVINTEYPDASASDVKERVLNYTACLDILDKVEEIQKELDIK